MFDLDLLVDEDEAERAFAILREAGYKMPANYTGAKICHHYPPLQKQGEPALVELHIRPLSQKCAPVVNNQTIKHKAVLHTFGSSPQAKAWLPSPTEQVLLFILHSEISHENHAVGQLDIRHAWDLPWFVQHHGEGIDWHEIETRANAAGYGRELAAYLLLLERYFALANPYHENALNREAEQHYRRVNSKMAQGPSRSDLVYLFFRHLWFAFSRSAMRNRYGAGEGWRLNYYRFYHLLWLFKKYSRLGQFVRLFHNYQLRIRDNAGR